MDDRPLFVLPKRKCGTPRSGLYLVSRMSPSGSLLPFTALAAPFESMIANPRSYQVVDMPSTLLNLGLTFDSDLEPTHNLPKYGIADMWGMSAGYPFVWDAIEETRRLGVSRRVANIPDIPFPIPVLMMHMHAMWDMPGTGETALNWLCDNFGWESLSEHNGVAASTPSMPWCLAKSLGHVGDDDYLWHPYARLWELIPQIDRDERLEWFLEWFQVEQRPGVFGLSWITHAAYVLGPGETEVPAKWADRAVPAVSETDPRAVDGISLLDD